MPTAAANVRSPQIPGRKPRSPHGLGDKDEAFKWIEKVFTEHDTAVLAFKTSPILDSLRSDPRFQDLVRRVGFLA